MMALNELADTTTVVHPGRPVPWKRTGGSGKRRYTDPRYRQWKTEFQWAAKLAHQQPVFTTPVAVVLFVATDGVIAQVTPIREWAGMASPYIGDRPKHVRGDLDNYCKAVGDALQTVVVKDDRLVSLWFAQWVDSISDVLDVPKHGNAT